jgi:hypothetical protein
MEVVIVYEYLTGARGKKLTKVFAVVYDNSIESFRFLATYSMNPHASPNSGLSWDDGIIPYSSLVQTFSEATVNLEHLYLKGNANCMNLSTILGRSVQNLDSFGCPERSEFRMIRGCTMTCHKFPDKSCALRKASTFLRVVNTSHTG